jgi:hypothetical protein
MHIFVDDESEAVKYFDTCARIRGISSRSLLRRILDTIVHDQMVGAILDDDCKRERRKGEHRYVGPRFCGKE